MSFFNELKRRNVFKVAAAYIIVGWLIMQVGDTLGPALLLPGWINSALAFFLILGFPLALFFAWAFEMTPEGIKREKDVDRGESITQITSQKLNGLIIGLLVLALGYFAFDKFVLTPDRQAAEIAEAVKGSGSIQSIEPDPFTENSIAVLPFANRSNMEDDLFFTDGIHDDLLTQLAKIEGLRVISRTSVMEYRDTTLKIPEIAAELGVGRILEGGVQRAGDRVRINAQLIDVNTDEHLWAETFDREMTVENLFDIQSEITQQIVQAVRGELTPEESDALEQLPTRSLAAYEAYLHARAAFNEPDYTADKYRRGAEWAQKAVDLDPKFYWAWGSLAEAHFQLIWIGWDSSPARLASGEAALDAILSNAPESSEAKLALGEYLYRVKGDYLGATEAFRAALALRPGSAYILLRTGVAERRTGLMSEAISSLEEALVLDPANRFLWTLYFETLLRDGKYEQAYPQLQEAIRRFPAADDIKALLGHLHMHWRGDLEKARAILDSTRPVAGPSWMSLAAEVPMYERDYDEVIATWNLPQAIEFDSYGSSPAGWRSRWLGEAWLLKGEEEVAHQVLRDFIQNADSYSSVVPRNRAFKLSSLAVAHALLGEHDRALELSREAMEIIDAVSDGFAAWFPATQHAMVLGLAGRRELAIRQLESTLQLPASMLTPWALRLDPRWDFLRDDERFMALATPPGLEDQP